MCGHDTTILNLGLRVFLLWRTGPATITKWPLQRRGSLATTEPKLSGAERTRCGKRWPQVQELVLPPMTWLPWGLVSQLKMRIISFQWEHRCKRALQTVESYTDTSQQCCYQAVLFQTNIPAWIMTSLTLFKMWCLSSSTKNLRQHSHIFPP